ncbi:regulatory LuxR family protein [Actinomycetospora succinea]|uniref:Regulatory LuxR family protein n=1 Tax=Actinomycetospora succinea TaxID=663603 RepID=A0A4R6UZD4_9PSEU|nr:helix-turn-helix transcriptional regulator [Actinomycetospora succinea]TDQ50995.1 regulatory LuxR family protein [Actinomycetospora succinea]
MTAVSAERVRTQIDGLAAAGLDWPTFGAAAIETLRKALPFSAACLATVDPATELVTATVKWGDVDDEHDLEWSYYEYEVEDVYDFREVSRRPGAVAALGAETGGDPTRSRRYAEMFAPVWDYSDELRAGLSADGATWGGLALFHQGGRTFTLAEQEFVTSVSAGFARGLRTGLVVGAADLAVLGDGSGPAVIVVGADDEVVSANVGAQERVTDLGGGPLGDAPLPQVVCAIVGAARRRAADPGAPMPRARLRSRSGRWVVAHASPMVGRGGTVADVVVTLEDARPPEVIPLVVASYGLTDRERDVVGLVLAGVDTADVAARLHLSAYTVQDHLKKIFAKVGVRSRRELIARIYNDHYVPHLVEGGALAPSGWFAGASGR